MQTNQPSNLSTKQQELVKRLEKIRENRQTEKKETKNRHRNKNVQQRKRQFQDKSEKTSTYQRVERKRQSPAVKPKKVIQTRKKSPSFMKSLQSGEDLAQAIVLSEILSKPVALRKHKR